MPGAFAEVFAEISGSAAIARGADHDHAHYRTMMIVTELPCDDDQVRLFEALQSLEVAPNVQMQTSQPGAPATCQWAHPPRVSGHTRHVSVVRSRHASLMAI